MPLQIVRIAQGRALFEKPRAARREHLVFQQRLDMEAGIAPAAITDREIEIARAEIDHIVGRGDPHIDLRPALLKAMQPHDEPLGGKGGGGGDGQRAGVVMRPQSPHRGLNPGKRVRQARQQHFRRDGQLDRTVEAMKQLYPEILFERVDLMADRGRGDVQLLRRLAEAFQPRGGFEGPKGAERRQMAVHLR